MALAPLDIANQALGLIKVGRLAAFPTDGTGTPQSQAIYNHYERTVKQIMARLDPHYLRHSAKLAYSSVLLTLSSGAVGTGVTCTAASATWLDGCKGQAILEVDADGADGTGVSEITVYTSSTVLTIENTTAWDDATPAANRWRLVPRDYGYEYLLPADCITARELDGTEALWKPASQRRLLADYAGAILTYTRYDEDPDNWDALLQEAAVYAVAAACAFPIFGDGALSRKWAEEADAVFARADGGVRTERQDAAPISVSVLRDCR